MNNVVKFSGNEGALTTGTDRNAAHSPTSNGGGDGGGQMDDIARRVAALEKGFEKMDGKIDRLTELVNSFGLKSAERLGAIEGRLTGMEAKLDSKASSAEVRELAGKVSSIPNVWQTLAIMGGLLAGVAGLAFALTKFAEPSRAVMPAPAVSSSTLPTPTPPSAKP